ncbi:GntR family transcriptional regulator [Novimethylophilus kurashikiensis]|uniref:GntR family transcriptional regulator n=1 Tax=Novimethylophilus kurashikiensis TaxID=1825523 RepID=A0A2R5F8Q4_9PROT|nr:GntR family transcriptional regulator [Novimethylophilus kurashikiensis]GBG14620.1 GntR family transcriptional regulator [Novimethylophilus kurashikiensis]
MNNAPASPSFRPLYEQIKVLITQSLIAGEWRPGEAIPSEMELAARFKVSQGTVRKAVDELAAENILVRRQGKGTYVATHNEEHTKLRFLRLTAADGKKELLENQLLECNRGKATAEMARQLGLKTGASIIEVKRLLSFSGKPVILDHIIIPAAPFKGLNGSKIQDNNGSMYSMYETQYGIRMVRAEERLKAIAADEASAQLLGVAVGTPLLRIERVSCTYGDKPMEWRLGLCVTEEHHYRNELE